MASTLPERPSSPPSSPAASPGASPPASPRQGIRHSATDPLSVSTTTNHDNVDADAHSPPSSPGSEQTKRHRHTLAGAARAVMFTQNWKPGITRANSWTPEDRKRSVQMSGLMEEEIPEGYSQYSER